MIARFCIIFALLTGALAAQQRHVFHLTNTAVFPGQEDGPEISVQLIAWHLEGENRIVDDEVTAKVAHGAQKTVGVTMANYTGFVTAYYFNGVPEVVGNSYVDNGGGDYVEISGATWAFEPGTTPPYYEPANIVEHNFDVAGGAATSNKVLPTADADKTLWLTQDETVTADLYREGVDKIVAAAKSSPGGTPAGSGMTKAEFESTATDAVAQAVGEALNENPEDGEAEAAGVVAEAQVVAAVGERELPDMGGASAGTASALTIELGNTGYTLDLDPATNERLANLGEFLRGAFAWVIYAYFQLWVWGFFKDMYLTVAGAEPAKGNPLIQGTGAQATSLIVAITVTAILVSMPTLFWAAADSGMTWMAGITGIGSAFDQASAGGGLMSTGLYLAGYYFPIGTAMAAFGSYLVIIKGALIVVAGLQTAIRFTIR